MLDVPAIGMDREFDDDDATEMALTEVSPLEPIIFPILADARSMVYENGEFEREVATIGK